MQAEVTGERSRFSLSFAVTKQRAAPKSRLDSMVRVSAISGPERRFFVAIFHRTSSKKALRRLKGGREPFQIALVEFSGLGGECRDVRIQLPDRCMYWKETKDRRFPE